MSDEKYTRCPGCRTVFRVTPAQLALRSGQVRCGHCRTVFDGTGHMIRLARPGPSYAEEDANTGPLTVTLRSAQALEPVTAMGGPAASTPAEPQAKPARAAAKPSEDVDYDHRFAWDRPRRRSGSASLVMGSSIALLVLLLAGQILWHYRDLIAGHWPAARPMLTRLCAVAGCTIRPLREIAGLSIEASDLQADPAHKGLLILNATVRNRAGYTVALPHLELTLTDAQDNVVVRRALAPADYAAGVANGSSGIAGNGELAVRLFVDASATQQSGYRVYLFYP